MPKPAPYTSAQPVDDFGLPPSNIKFGAVMPAAAITSVVVPGDYPAYQAVFRVEPGANREVWVAINETAEKPAGGTFASTTSELLIRGQGLSRIVKAGDTISAKVGGTNTVHLGVVLYPITIRK